MSSFADEVEYKLQAVKATQLGPDEIDTAFRPACIGKPKHLSRPILFRTLELVREHPLTQVSMN
jgi:hypothetical protein